MNSLRFNPFKQVHQGLRALLYDTALCIQHTNFNNEKEADETIKKIELTLMLFYGHAEIEDTKVLPAINAYAPAIVTAFETEHEKDAALAKAVEDLIHAYRTAGTADSRKETGISLQLSFIEFVAFNLQHMNREETIVNEILWQHFTDESLMKMIQEIGATIPPEKNQYYALWMLKGNNNEDVINWFNAVKATAPIHVFDNLYSLAAANLDKERWNKIGKVLDQSEVTERA